VDVATGASRWRFSTGGYSVEGSTSVHDGIVYFGSDAGTVSALRASTTGKKLRSWHLGASISASTPEVAGGRVFVGSADGRVYGLSSTTGARLWTFRAAGRGSCRQTYTPAVSGGAVYVGSNDSNVYALRASTGRRIWVHHTGNGVEYVSATGGVVVYAWSLDGKKYSLRASNGSTRWRFRVGGRFPPIC
jgi:outer membrane protein assembly factor BamB